MLKSAPHLVVGGQIIVKLYQCDTSVNSSRAKSPLKFRAPYVLQFRQQLFPARCDCRQTFQTYKNGLYYAELKPKPIVGKEVARSAQFRFGQAQEPLGV